MSFNHMTVQLQIGITVLCGGFFRKNILYGGRGHRVVKTHIAYLMYVYSFYGFDPCDLIRQWQCITSRKQASWY